MLPGWSRSWRRFRIAAWTKCLSTRALGDLGFDSLMFVELARRLKAGGTLTAPERLNEVQDVRELLTVVDRQAAQGAKREPRLRLDPEKDDEIHIPELLKTVGNKTVELAQRALYERLLRTKYEAAPTFRPIQTLSRPITPRTSTWAWSNGPG